MVSNMRNAEITHPFTPPITHPYLATISIDPVDARRFLQLMEHHPELTLCHIDRQEPDCWIIYLGCASEEACDRVQDAW